MKSTRLNEQYQDSASFMDAINSSPPPSPKKPRIFFERSQDEQVSSTNKIIHILSIEETAHPNEDDYYHANTTHTLVAQSPPQNPIDELLRKQGLKKGQTIGDGTFGSAIAYTYHQHDPAMVSLCKREANIQTAIIKRHHFEELTYQYMDPPYIATTNKKDIQRIKKANGSIHIYNNELEIYQYLINQSIPIEQRKYPNAMILQEGDDRCLMLEYISCGQHALSGKLQSMDLKNFIQRISSDRFEETFLKKLLNDIFAEMHDILYQLHQLNLVHLDFSPRNCVIESLNTQDKNHLVKLKVIDFGLSKLLDDHGSCTFMPDLTQCSIPFPHYIYDKNMLVQHNAVKAKEKDKMTTSVYTDLFSMKASIIEVLAYLLGMKDNEVFKFENEGRSTVSNLYLLQQVASESRFVKWKKDALTMEDSTRLSKYVHNLKQRAEARKDWCGSVVQIILDYYSSYLTHVPQVNGASSALLREDSALFLACHQKLAAQLELNEDLLIEMRNKMQSFLESQSISLGVPTINPTLQDKSNPGLGSSIPHPAASLPGNADQPVCQHNRGRH